jgi:AcrR family transcriptional regulator
VEGLVDGGEAYGDLAVERLLKAGGVSRSAFYNYFEDKGDLLRAMAALVVGEISAAGAHWWDLDPDADRADLRAALQPAIDAYRRHRTILGAMFETAIADPRVREQRDRLVEDTVAGLAAHIAARQADGRAAPDLHPEHTARWIVWMLEQGQYALGVSAGDAEADAMFDSAADILWRTLYAGFR